MEEVGLVPAAVAAVEIGVVGLDDAEGQATGTVALDPLTVVAVGMAGVGEGLVPGKGEGNVPASPALQGVNVPATPALQGLHEAVGGKEGGDCVPASHGHLVPIAAAAEVGVGGGLVPLHPTMGNP